MIPGDTMFLGVGFDVAFEVYVVTFLDVVWVQGAAQRHGQYWSVC